MMATDGNEEKAWLSIAKGKPDISQTKEY